MKFPPLHALRAFDAVARLGGVRAAAEALFVTPGAVTQQLRALEEDLGVALVQRLGRGVALTEAGRSLHMNTARHLRAIAMAAEGVRGRRARVRVTAAPSVAVRWLVPRLRSFSAAHPDVEVLVDASPDVADLRSGAWDVALREGEGRYAGLHSELLFPLDVVPVASPGYRPRGWRTRATRWRDARLLHDAGTPWWPRWLEQAHEAQGGPGDPAHGLYFSHTAMAIEAAIAGQGVALAAPVLVQHELASGTLVVWDRQPLVTGVGVHAVWMEREEAMPAVPAVRLFRQWLRAEAGQDRQLGL